jgi:hypothetical protein
MQLNHSDEPFVGQTANYRWFATTRHVLHDLLVACPEVVLGKCVVVSSFDSGTLVPTAEELRKGWLAQGRLAVLPYVATVGDLPHDLYDEWYVFASPTIPDVAEIFVNHGGFTLQPVSVSYEFEQAQRAVGFMADLKMIQQKADNQQGLIDSFWAQIERIRPMTYIGDGDNLIFATLDALLFDRVRARLQG